MKFREEISIGAVRFDSDFVVLFDFNRDMSKTLLAQFNCSGEGFNSLLDECTSFSDLCATIRKRYKLPLTEVFLLQYASPSCPVIYLDNDEDLKLLFYFVDIYKMRHVEILVVKEKSVGSSSEIISFGDCESAVIDENYLLGEPFRDAPRKVYLSDDWSSLISCVGQKFSGVEEFRDVLTKYAVCVGFRYVMVRNDQIYVHALYENFDEKKVKCEWYVRGSVLAADGCFYISDLNLVHNCKGVVRTNKHKQFGSKLVRSLIETDVSYNLGLTPKEIVDKVQSSYGFKISYKVALVAKKRAVDKLYDTDAESFNILNWYRDEVLKTNPGSSVILEVNESSYKFERVFVAYGGQIEGFKYCLPVMYVDGTFGKSVYKGQILSATGRTGNKGIFPFAICICDSETESNWEFFFSHLKNVLEPQGRTITFISDRGPGLLKAFDIVFPGNLHLYCYHHLTKNLRDKYKGQGSSVVDDVIKAFQNVAYASTEVQYHHMLRKLVAAGGATIINNFINDTPLQYWCQTFFRGCRYGIMANGIAKSFNNWIRVERCMPPYAMLDQTRLKEMQQMSDRRSEAEKWTTELTPKMEAHLKIEMDKSRGFRLISSQHGVYEVKSDKYSYCVNLYEQTCSCVKWQINCFPCPHALAAIQGASLNVYDFIDSYFYVDVYKMCYSFPLHPVSNVDAAYIDYSDEPIFPPACKRPPGRPKTKRIKSTGEVSTKMIQCGRCHKMGNHNKITCKEPLPR